MTLQFQQPRWSEQGERISAIEGAALGAALGAIIGLAYSHTNIEAPVVGTVIGAVVGAVSTFVRGKFPLLYAYVVGVIGLVSLGFIWTIALGIRAPNTTPGMSIVSWIILGLIAGFIGSKILTGTTKTSGSISY